MEEKATQPNKYLSTVLMALAALSNACTSYTVKSLAGVEPVCFLTLRNLTVTLGSGLCLARNRVNPVPRSTKEKCVALLRGICQGCNMAVALYCYR